MAAERRYLPAASVDFLLPAYDPIMRLLGFTRALQPLVDQAALRGGHRILEIGCGTGTLLALIARSHPDVEITGSDPDPLALDRAAGKARRDGFAATLDRGFADALPYPDAAFDRVFSSMMFHHVRTGEKPGVLAEVRRVLKPGGRLELLDFAGGQRTLLAHALHGRAPHQSADGRLVQMMTDAGLVEARRTAARRTVAGAIAYYQASRRA